MGEQPHGGATEVNPVMSARGGVDVAKLSAVAGPGKGRAMVMARAVATVGRHNTNDLVLPDPRVSGVHLELSRVVGGIHVRDIGSTNGTWLGVTRIVEATLGFGSEVTVGDTVLRVESDRATEPVALTTHESFGAMVGATPAMRELFTTLERIAPKDLSVLVQGETGTGKEEVARAIHASSRRANAPFVVIDATALPENLAESLLFGHEKGSFTGAADRRIGYFEAASGGTVFIDELGELAPHLQAKFLRVLERHEVTRLGATVPSKVDVRVIAATNRDLRNEIERGRFREDVYYRVAQVRVYVPPLRDRRDDVPLLCRKLLADADPPVMIEAEALEHLAAQSWPGNVRELRNVLVRASALARDGVIRRADVVGEGLGLRDKVDSRGMWDLAGTFSQAKDRAVEGFERAYLAGLMRRTSGNISQAAREADLARHHLRDLLKKRGLYGIVFSDEE